MKSNSDTQKKHWKGYDFEQLQYRRIITEARIAAERQRIGETAQMVKQQNPLLSVRNARTLFSAISYIDYAVMAVKIFRKVKPLFSSK